MGTPANVSGSNFSESPEVCNSLLPEGVGPGFHHKVDVYPGEEEGGASPDPRDGRCDGGREHRDAAKGRTSEISPGRREISFLPAVGKCRTGLPDAHFK